MYKICDKVRAFDPNFAHTHVDAAFVDSLDVITPLVGLGMLTDLKRDLPNYLAAAAGAPTFDHSSVDDYTKGLLEWWHKNGGRFPAWARAARVVFALTPNSASCERVFALLKRMFGEQQLAALADQIRAGVMLAYNDREVG